MNDPLVYVVILNWNGLEDTIACLDSIGEMDYSNVRTIVVDNFSSGDQVEVLKKHPYASFVLAQIENLGFCGGCNVGIRRAIDDGAEFVLLLNNDTIVTSDLIDKLLIGFRSLDDAGAVSPLIFEHPEIERLWFSESHWVPEKAQFRLTPGESEEKRKVESGAPYQSDFACGCCLFAPTEVFVKFGLLDERYFAFYDEAEWCSRLRRNGLHSYVIPTARMFHKVSRSTPSMVSTYLLTRNRLLWMRENLDLRIRMRSSRYLIREFVWHLFNQTGLTNGYYSKRHSKAVLAGYRDYLLGRFGKWDERLRKLLFE